MESIAKLFNMLFSTTTNSLSAVNRVAISADNIGKVMEHKSGVWADEAINDRKALNAKIALPKTPRKTKSA